MLSLRILTVDSYQCSPVKEYDVCYSDFRGSEIYKVPVIRVVGNTPAGQKGCLHIHGVFPYLSVRCKDVFPGIDVKSSREYTQKLALEIDKALNVEERKTASNPHHVYNIEVTQRLCLYGYHEEKEDFLKIYFYNPIDVMRTANNLTNCKVLNKFIQPHEAHIPFILQFFIDHNLFGMNFIKTSSFKFRASGETYIAATSPLRNQDISNSDDSDIANKVWDVTSLSSSQINGLPRESVCELEADCCKSDIINKKEISSQHGNNPGLQSIWAEERLRRQTKNEASQISFEESQERSRVQTQNEVLYKRLENILHEREESINLNKTEEIDESNFPDSQSTLSNKSLSDLFGLSNTEDNQLLQVFMDLANSQSNMPDEDSILGTKNEISKEDDEAEEAEMSQRDDFFHNLSSSFVSCDEVSTDMRDAINVHQLDGTYDDEDSASFVPKLSKEGGDITPRCQSDSNFSDEPPILEPENDLTACVTNNEKSLERNSTDSNITAPSHFTTSQDEKEKTVLPSENKVVEQITCIEEPKLSKVESPEQKQNLFLPWKSVDCGAFLKNRSNLEDCAMSEKCSKTPTEITRAFQTSIVKPCCVSLIRNKFLDQYVQSKSSEISLENQITLEAHSKLKADLKDLPPMPEFKREEKKDGKYEPSDNAVKNTKPSVSCETISEDSVSTNSSGLSIETNTRDFVPLFPTDKELPRKDESSEMSTVTPFTESIFMPPIQIKQEPLSPVNDEGDDIIYNPYADTNLFDYKCQESTNSFCESYRQFEPDVFSNSFGNSFFSKHSSIEKSFSSLSNSTESSNLLPLIDTSIVKVEEAEFILPDSNQSSSTHSSKVGSEYVRLKKLSDADILNYTSKSSDCNDKFAGKTTAKSSVKSSSKRKHLSSSKHRRSEKSKKDHIKCINSKYIDPTKKYPENSSDLNISKEISQNMVSKPKEIKNFQNEIASMVNAAMDSFPTNDGLDNILISNDNSLYSDASNNIPPHSTLQSFGLSHNSAKKLKSSKLSNSKTNSFQPDFMKSSMCEVPLPIFNGTLISHKSVHAIEPVENSTTKQDRMNQLEFKQIHPSGANLSKKSSKNSGTKTKGENHGKTDKFSEEESLNKSKADHFDKLVVEANSFSNEQRLKTATSSKNSKVSQSSLMNLDKASSSKLSKKAVEDFKRNPKEKLDKNRKFASGKNKKVENDKSKKVESDKSKKVESDKSKKVETDKSKKVESDKSKKVESDKSRKVEKDMCKKVVVDKVKKVESDRSKKVESDRSKKVESDRSKKVESDKSKKVERDKSKKDESVKSKKIESDKSSKVENDKSKKVGSDKSKKGEREKSKKVGSDVSKKSESDKNQKIESEKSKKMENDKNKNTKSKEIKSLSLKKNKQKLNETMESLIQLDTSVSPTNFVKAVEDIKGNSKENLQLSPDKNKVADNDKSKSSKQKEIKSLSLKKNKQNLNRNTASNPPKKLVNYRLQDDSMLTEGKPNLIADPKQDSVQALKQDQLKNSTNSLLNKGTENIPDMLKTASMLGTSNAKSLPQKEVALPAKLPVVKLQKLSYSELIKYKNTTKEELPEAVDTSSSHCSLSFKVENDCTVKAENKTHSFESGKLKKHSKKSSEGLISKNIKSVERCVKCKKKAFKCKCQDSFLNKKTNECNSVTYLKEKCSDDMTFRDKELDKRNLPENDLSHKAPIFSSHNSNENAEFSFRTSSFRDTNENEQLSGENSSKSETAHNIQDNGIISPRGNNCLNEVTNDGSLECQETQLILEGDTKNVISDNSIEKHSDIGSEKCVSDSYESKDTKENSSDSSTANSNENQILINIEPELSINQSMLEKEESIDSNIISPEEIISEISIESPIQSIKNYINVNSNHSKNDAHGMNNIDAPDESSSPNILQKTPQRLFSCVKNTSNKLSLKLNKKENSVTKAKNVLQSSAKKKWMVDRRLFGESKFAVKKKSKERVSEIVSDSCLRIKLGSPENAQIDKQSISKVLLKGKLSPNFKDSFNEPPNLISEEKVSRLSKHSKITKCGISGKQKNRMQKLNLGVKSRRRKVKGHLKDETFKTKSKTKQIDVTPKIEPVFITRHPRKCKEKLVNDSKNQCNNSLNSNKSSDPYSSDDSVTIIDTVKPVKSPHKHSHKDKGKHLKTDSKRKHSSNHLSPTKIPSEDFNEGTAVSPSIGIPKMKISLKWLTTRNNETRVVVVNKELKGLEDGNKSDSDSVQEIFRYEPEPPKTKTFKRRRLSSSHKKDHRAEKYLQPSSEINAAFHDESKKIAPLKINLASSRVTCEEVEKIKTLTLTRNPNSISIGEYTIKKEILSDEETPQNENDFVFQQSVQPIKRGRGRPRKVPSLNSPVIVQKTASPQKDVSPLKFQSSFCIDNSSPNSKIRILKKPAAECATKIDNSLHPVPHDYNISTFTPQIIGGVVIKQEVDSDGYVQEIKIPKKRGRKPGKVHKQESASRTSFEVNNDMYPDTETLSSPIFKPANRVITRRESLRPRHDVKYFPTDQNSDEEKEDLQKSPRKRSRKNSAPGKISSDSTKDANFTTNYRRLQVQNLLESCNSFSINLKKLSSTDISNLTTYRKETKPQNMTCHINKMPSNDSDVEIISETVDEINKVSSYKYSSEHLSKKINIPQSNVSPPFDNFLQYGNTSNIQPLSSNLSSIQNMNNYFEPLEQSPKMRPYNGSSTSLAYDQSQQDDLLPPWDMQQTYSDDPVKQEMSSPVDSNPDVLNSAYFSPCNYNIPESTLEQENACNFSQSQPNFAEQNYNYGTSDRNYSYLPDCMNDMPKAYNDLNNQTSMEKSFTSHPSIPNINNPILNDIDQFNLSCSPTSNHPSACEATNVNMLQKPINSFESNKKTIPHYPLDPGFTSQNVHSNIPEYMRKGSPSYDHVMNNMNDLTSNISFHNRREESIKVTSDQQPFTNKDCRLNSSPHIRHLSNHMPLETRPSDNNELFTANKNNVGSVLDSSHDDSSFDITSDKMDISPASDAFLMDGHAFSDNQSSPNENKLTDSLQIPPRSNEGSMNFFNRNTIKNKAHQFAQPIVPNFENKSSHFEVRTFDLSEGMIESDSELHPLGSIGLNPIEEFKNNMTQNLSNSNIITNCSSFGANNMNFIPTLPVKPLVPTYYPEVTTKTSQPLYPPANDALSAGDFIARPETVSDANAIINPSNATSLFEIPYNCNMISVCDPLSEYYTTHSSANRPSINFVPTVMVAEPATHQVNLLYNTAPIIVTGSSVNEETYSQRNELVQSCSVSSTSDTDTPSNAQSIIQPNEKLDILSVAVKECNIGEEYDPDNELMEEDKTVYSEPDLQVGRKDQFYFKTNTPNCNSPDTLCTNLETTPKNSPYSRDMQKDFLGRTQHNFSPQLNETNTIEIDRKHPNDFGVMETAVPSPQKKHKHTLGLVSSVPKSVLCGDKQNPSPTDEMEVPLSFSSSQIPSPELFNEVELHSKFDGSENNSDVTHNPCFHSDEQQHKNRVLNNDSHKNCDKVICTSSTKHSLNQDKIPSKNSKPFLGKQLASLDINQLKTQNLLTSTLLKQIEKRVCEEDILKIIQKTGSPELSENIENLVSLKLRKAFENSDLILKDKLKSVFVNNKNICFPLFSLKNNPKSPCPSPDSQNVLKNDDESSSFTYNDTIQSFYGDETLCELNSTLTFNSNTQVDNDVHDIEEVTNNNKMDDLKKNEKDFNSTSISPSILQPSENLKERGLNESTFDKFMYVFPKKPPRPSEVKDWATSSGQNERKFKEAINLESHDEESNFSEDSVTDDMMYQHSNLSSASSTDINEDSVVAASSEMEVKRGSDLPDQEISSVSILKQHSTNNLESTPCVSRMKRRTLIPKEIGVSPINKNSLLTRDADRKKCLFPDEILPNERHQKLSKTEHETWDRKLRNEMDFHHNVTSSQIDGPTLDNSKGFKVNSINIEDVKENHEVQLLTLMSLEIHVNTRHGYMPDPRFDSISAVFYYIYYDAGIHEKKILGVIHVDSLQSDSSERAMSDLKNVLQSERKVHDCQFFSVPTEMMLFEKLISIIREWDPDILIGYEIQMTSWGYLKNRAATLNVNLISLLSRLSAKKATKGSSIEIDPTVTDQTADLDSLIIPGRIVLNVWRIMRKEINLNTYSFENVYFHALHRRTPRYTFDDLTCWYRGMKKSFVARYYVTRVIGTIQLLEKFDVVRRTSELARLFGIQFYDVLSRGSQFRVESMMLRTAGPLLYVPVSPSSVQRAHSRALECVPLILEPESNFYTDPVVVLDFQSLYPSMIIAYNYCFSTCLGRLEHFGKNVPFDFGCTSLTVPLPMLRKLWKENNIHVSPTGIAFVKANVRRGVLPVMLEEILNTRIMVKRSLKKNKDNIFLKKLLDARQLGLKLIANVTYGYTGASFSGRMPCVEVADSIVGKGRETLENAIHIIENTPKWEAKVVYGDTDSLFILLKGRSKDEAFKIGQEIADVVTLTNPKPVKLKFEKVYLPCVLQTKKRYVGYMYETIDQKVPTYDAKGIETVRRDTCPATAKILQRSLKILFETYNVSMVEKYVQKQFSRILKERVNLSDFIFAKEYRGMNGYRPGACVPALEIAKKRLSKDPRSEPRVGERVPYVIVYGFPGMPIIRLVREPIELVKDNNLRLNATYYITRVIIPPLERVFSLIKADVKAWYTSIAHKITFSLPMASGLNQNKGTLTQYFKTQNCPCCSKTTTLPICEYCQKDPQWTVITLTEKIRKWEKAVIQINQICASCTKSLSSDCGCISVDCPVLFKLNLSKRDLSQAPYLRGLINQELF
ncbi:uncharacterized protein [Parasteatoda tepidariorum]|uniref:uncharacterized protein isoform X1 n=2 Tax=Parasteatoda tepidariorum TaxID=114398 RepID=UPI001C71E32A|nr:DNA polymerase zeta catalytic subunit isoform X1 [Parasteatoda tepidariorum]